MPAAAAIPWIVLAVSAASAGYSAYSQVKAGQAQKKAAYREGDALLEAGKAEQRVSESQASLSDYNAQVAALQALDAESRGEWMASRLREQIAQVIGAQRAGFAAGNIDVGFGSPVDVAGDAAYLGELDVLMVTTNAAREAWGYRVSAYNYTEQAKILRLEGDNALRAGYYGLEARRAAGSAAQSAAYWSAGGTLLNAGSSMLLARYPIQPAQRTVTVGARG